jgi:hypothetical protein
MEGPLAEGEVVVLGIYATPLKEVFAMNNVGKRSYMEASLATSILGRRLDPSAAGNTRSELTVGGKG